MTRDYRSRVQQASPEKKPPAPAWVPFFYGFLLGMVFMAVAWFVLTPPGTQLVLPSFASTVSKSAKKAVETGKQEQPERPRFDFYTILPEMEVVISDEEATPPDVEDKPASAVSKTADVSYRLQVGSFKKMSDADRQKARLALLGVEAEIQKVNIGQGDVYYRVLTTPFDSKQELNAKRKMFQQNKINSLVVQMKN